MITAVSLNPSIDRTIAVESFAYGAMNRVVSARSDAYGKAVNVAIVAASLGAQTECVGLMCRENGRTIEKRLLAHGVQTEFLWREGSVRTNIKLLDRSKGVVTEINEQGPAVTLEQLIQCKKVIAAHAEESDFLVLTGSLPPGCPPDYYAELIDAVSGLSCRCALDAEGEVLRAGIAAKPFLIKPNRAELEKEIGHPVRDLNEVKRAALSFTEKGVSLVAVSLGEDGALLTDGDVALFAPRVEVPVRSTVGAGDSMLAGLLSGLLAELPLEEVLKRGVACATAAVMVEGTQLMEKSDYKEIMQKITVQKV